AGSRLRLTVSGVNSLWWERNYNSGGVVADETAADARPAHITLYHDRAHPSRLALPVATQD
ncbi:MAG: X-Pro dipeptidyl-peptidase, partial [Gemmatimonadota bacterium]